MHDVVADRIPLKCSETVLRNGSPRCFATVEMIPTHWVGTPKPPHVLLKILPKLASRLLAPTCPGPTSRRFLSNSQSTRIPVHREQRDTWACDSCVPTLPSSCCFWPVRPALFVTLESPLLPPPPGICRLGGAGIQGMWPISPGSPPADGGLMSASHAADWLRAVQEGPMGVKREVCGSLSTERDGREKRKGVPYPVSISIRVNATQRKIAYGQ